MTEQDAGVAAAPRRAKASRRRRLPRGVVQRRRADGSTYFMSWAGTGVDGKKAWSEPCATVADAEEARRTMQGIYAEIPAGATFTFKDALDATQKEIEQNRSAGHARWFKSMRKVLSAAIGDATPVERIKAGHVRRARDAWLKESISRATVIQRRNGLSRVFRTEKVAERVQGRNPVREIKTWPSVRAAARHAFRADEVKAALDLIRAEDVPSAETDALVVHALFATGLRRSELARVRVRDVRFDTGMLWVRGKKRDQELPLTPDALTAFRRLVELAGADKLDATLLPGDGAHLVSRAFIRTESVVEKIRKGRAWTPHIARHTFISLLAAAGVDLGMLQRFSRIDSIAILRRYMHSVRPAEAEIAIVSRALSAPPPAPQIAKVQA